MERNYIYHVVFICDTGFGTCKVKRTKPIYTAADMEELSKAVAEANSLKTVGIVNFIRLKG
jgi:hypothetical protein